MQRSGRKVVLCQENMDRRGVAAQFVFDGRLAAICCRLVARQCEQMKMIRVPNHLAILPSDFAILSSRGPFAAHCGPFRSTRPSCTGSAAPSSMSRSTTLSSL